MITDRFPRALKLYDKIQTVKIRRFLIELVLKSEISLEIVYTRKHYLPTFFSVSTQFGLCFLRDQSVTFLEYRICSNCPVIKKAEKWNRRTPERRLPTGGAGHAPRYALYMGGIGGVMTHPERQGQGLASKAMREASRIFSEEWKVAFALLFCRPHLVGFYKRLDWNPFQGKLFVEQTQGKIEFSANGAMVLNCIE